MIWHEDDSCVHSSSRTMSNEGQEYANLYTIFFLNKEINQLRKNKQKITRDNMWVYRRGKNRDSWKWKQVKIGDQ